MKQRYIELEKLTATASATVNNQYVAKQQKGRIIGIELLTGNTTVADLQSVTISILTNGDQVLKGGTPLEFSSLFAGNGRTIIPVDVDPGGTVDVSTVNAAVTDVVFYVKYIYDTTA